MFCSLLMTVHVTAQDHKHVLFLGNSYTFSNDLPEMLSTLALSAGDTVTHASNTPGGYTFSGHTTNATSLSLIEQVGWDYVVLQEQSQAPSFPIEQVETEVFPYAAALDSMIRSNNPCAETVFFMTWGRKNGDASNCAVWPPVCTYEGMDDLLRERYIQMAIDNDAMVCAAGAVWRYIRENNTTIELYQTDGSHPSFAGTYAIACSFYSALFQKSATLITDDLTLSSDEAAYIREAVDAVIFTDMTTWLIGSYPVVADFNTTLSDNGQVQFSSMYDAQTAQWDFGDGQVGNGNFVSHTYAQTGTYAVTLTLEHCGATATSTQTIVVENVSVSAPTKLEARWFPNPADEFITVVVARPTRLTLWNAMGEQVMQQTINEGTGRLSIAHLSAGIYCMQLDNTSAMHHVIIR